MKKQPFLNRYTLFSILLCLGTMNSSPATAGSLALSDVPLFLTTSAESNIFFVFDNSRSMNSEAITPNAGDKNQGSTIPAGGNDYSTVFGKYGKYVYDSSHSEWDLTNVVTVNSGNAAPTTAPWARSSAYNTLYFDPTKNYKPWPLIPPNDTDTTISATADSKTATQMKEYPATAAPINPMDPNGVKVDLTADWPLPENGTAPVTDPLTYKPMVYYTWTDSNSNGVADTSDTYTKVTISPTDTTTVQNFTNWFVYHRKREYEAKYAMGRTIVNIPLGTRLRLGYENLSGTAGTGQIRMTSVTSKVADAATDTGYAQRQTMIDSIYKLASNASTPLRAAFQRAGNYFACSGNATKNENPWGSIDWTNTTTEQCALQKTPASDPPAACQQNFVVVVTDGTDNDFDASASGTDNAAVNTDKTTKADSFYAGTDYIDADNDSDSSFDTTAYQSSTENGMADLAMYFYENDFDAKISNKVPTICGVDENPGQHVVTYALSFGLDASVKAPTSHLQLNLDPLKCNGGSTVSAPSGGWDDLFNDTSNTVGLATRLQRQINDLKHAAYNGRGNFYGASDPDKLLKGLSGVLGDVSARRGAASTTGFSGTSNDTGTLAFLSSFNSGGWYGDLVAEAFQSDGSLSQAWSAADILDKLSNTDVTGTGRTIITYNNDSQSGQAFTWSGISTEQQTDLETAADGSTEADTIGKLRLDYIRGDHSCEASSSATSGSCADKQAFRPRTKAGVNTRLGDMINSSPIYVGEPIGNYPNTAPFPTGTDSYQTFHTDNVSRTPMVYIGGNDGMLHGFEADTTANGGKEIFAYVPGALSSTSSSAAGLHKLTEAGGHHSYVDLTPSIADAYTTTPTDTTRAWHTVLVGGLRSGGKGVYALDITDPVSNMTTETNAAKKVMWEFTPDTYSSDNSSGTSETDLGYTYSEPVIVPLRVGNGSTTSDIQWFAIFGNGYNSTNGDAVLFLLKLSGPTGSDGKWVLNKDYYKIDTGVGDSTDPNGLSSPAVIDNDGDGIYDRVYAGDRRGNMWAFDLNTPTGVPKDDWASAYDVSGTPKPLFTAEISTTAQPITSKPLVIRNKAASGGGLPNVLVLFGTGSYLADTDLKDPNKQSYYAVWDHGSQELTRSDLLAKTMQQDSGGRIITSSNPGYTASPNKDGWYIDLPDTGERVISRSFLIGSNLFFSSIVPTSSPCAGGGSTWLMAVDPTTGDSPGLPTFDYNKDGNVDDTDLPTTFKNDKTNLAGMQTDSLIPQFTFLVKKDITSTTNPCANGTAVMGMGTTSEASLVSQTLCTGASSAKAGRYSWRQLDFN